MAINVSLSLPHIKKITIVSDRPEILSGTVLDERNNAVEIRSIHPAKDLSPLLPTSLIHQIYEPFRELFKAETGTTGLVILDPLCPLRRVSHVREAISLFLQQTEGSRPWSSVYSVELLQNHFHPKKIVRITGDNYLEYNDPNGRNVYNRQQLEGDCYYLQNHLIYIIDPMIFDNPSHEIAKDLAYICREPMVTIKKKSDLARVLYSARNETDKHTDD